MNPILCEFLDIQSELKTQTLYKKQPVFAISEKEIYRQVFSKVCYTIFLIAAHLEIKSSQNIIRGSENQVCITH